MNKEILNDMALFVEVVRARSFRGAAQTLGMPNSTISRRVSALEKTIGLRLLNRTTRTMELTEAGKIYYERCSRIVTEARLAHAELGDMLVQPMGTLRASLPVDFSTIYLAPICVEFARTYPEVTFEFDLSPHHASLISEPFDVAIRIGPSKESSLISRKIAEVIPRFFASPSYIQERGDPSDPDELSTHSCLAMGNTHRWKVTDGTREVEVSVQGRYTVNSAGFIRRLAILGEGILLLPPQMVADDLASGQLQQVLPNWRGVPMPIYAITETRLLPAKTQRFIEFLRDKLAKRPVS